MSIVCRRMPLGDTEVLVTGAYYPGEPARTYGPPEDCYPGDPEYIDIFSVQINGVQVDSEHFSEKLLLSWEQSMINEMADDAASAAETRAEARKMEAA